MQLNQLKRKHPGKRAKLVGRGGKRGKTSGRGTKGQKARAGHSIRPQTREVMKRLPKQRGFKWPSITEKPKVVNLSHLEAKLPAGVLTPAVLAEKGMVSRRGGRLPAIKILGDGEVTKKFVVSGMTVSKVAKEKIEKAGGEVKEINK
jgi:large subunit ribosomal protein L15